MRDNELLFACEPVTEGHPDKIADQISGAVGPATRGRTGNAQALRGAAGLDAAVGA